MSKFNSSTISSLSSISYPSTSSLAIDIEESTVQNPFYRRVIFTNKFQLVLMTLLPGETIPTEKHDTVDQFVRVESGSGIAMIGNDRYHIKENSAIAIHSGTWHRFINNGNENLSLYVIYSSPQHASDEIDERQPLSD